MNDSLKLVGTLKVVLSDSDGNIKEEHDFKNLVVDTGKAFTINALIASSTVPFTYIAIGTGTTAADTSNTGLQTEVTRVAFSYATTTSSVTMTSIFAPGVGTGTITEAGIFNSASSGTMLSRTVFSPVSKTASDQLTIIWTINLT
jgi:hypothetical protein